MASHANRRSGEAQAYGAAVNLECLGFSPEKASFEEDEMALIGLKSAASCVKQSK
jgi:hypothetical protein